MLENLITSHPEFGKEDKPQEEEDPGKDQGSQKAEDAEKPKEPEEQDMFNKDQTTYMGDETKIRSEFITPKNVSC